MIPECAPVAATSRRLSPIGLFGSSGDLSPRPLARPCRRGEAPGDGFHPLAPRAEQLDPVAALAAGRASALLRPSPSAAGSRSHLPGGDPLSGGGVAARQFRDVDAPWGRPLAPSERASGATQRGGASEERHERVLDDDALRLLQMVSRPAPDRASIAPRLRPLLPFRSVSSVVSTTGICARFVVTLRSRSVHL